ncbi:hypothetical protein TIFTF001_028508 [Ficus carica]|uniref:RNase H type-1 domain-containing protein n=1 Tax=Ficus carica TaxID=3494 RepID=A0AA88DR93_FICCA|nr:hypothetical protein TIFTF001_028508 [Ficus carica]
MPDFCYYCGKLGHGVKDYLVDGVFDVTDMSILLYDHISPAVRRNSFLNAPTIDRENLIGTSDNHGRVNYSVINEPIKENNVVNGEVTRMGSVESKKTFRDNTQNDEVANRDEVCFEFSANGGVGNGNGSCTGVRKWKHVARKKGNKGVLPMVVAELKMEWRKQKCWLKEMLRRIMADGGASLVFMAIQFVVNDIFQKEGESDLFQPSMIRFIETVENCQLVDLQCDGPKLTWDNSLDDEDNIRERLDRMLGSEDLISLYLNFSIQVLNFYDSDHRALWLELVDEAFGAALRDSWRPMNGGVSGDCWNASLGRCASDLRNWSSQTLYCDWMVEDIITNRGWDRMIINNILFLVDQEYAPEVWDSSLWPAISNAKVGSFDGLCVIWSNMALKTNLKILCDVASAIWKARNQWIHDGPKVSAMETLEKVGRFLRDYQACSKKIHGSFSPFMAECLALMEDLLFVKNCGICIQITEVDGTRVVQAVNCGDSLAEEGAVINDIIKLFSISPQWSCSAICHEANRVAHCLAASMFILENEVHDWDKVPIFVTPMVLADLAY